MRYELGVALEQQLAEDCPVELHAAFAQLPSITSVGMASLLPGAGQQPLLRQQNTGLVPMLGEVPVTRCPFRKSYASTFDVDNV